MVNYEIERIFIIKNPSHGIKDLLFTSGSISGLVSVEFSVDRIIYQ